MKMGKCKACKQTTIIGGRGLCHSRCYPRHRSQGTIENYPRKNWKREDLLAEYNICRARGLSVREAAEKIGVSLSALRKAIERDRHHAQPAVGPRSS